MVKADLVERVAEVTGLPKVKCKEIVDGILDEIFNALVRGERVSIRRFGTFEVVRSNRTKGRNLQTGEEIYVEPKNVVRFRPSRQIRKVIE
ncbi:DNA-binding protein HU-beta [Thermosulfidibacter takaii ABI70S6]|uniref:DNA-binding protein HU-beta n=1 Tax=Thermosulfidibacter takaii (strain DSM 17441 / JCM 13301 / NBRC 103674 / ABI70S6) TaxID=1298851 RepID=A0A0S3QS55_THET7|nr:HU family DNA-binding protein [Thermosulfidibacter takaii]BAT71160.1 DNA-binding protein HU-beta [Thermosulfidibacter takaii ABI70S6]